MVSPDFSSEQRGISPDEAQPIEIHPGEEVTLVGLTTQPEVKPTPEQFADQLRALVDPRTPAEIAAARASRDRVSETEQRLRRELGLGKTAVDWRATW